MGCKHIDNTRIDNPSGSLSRLNHTTTAKKKEGKKKEK